MKKILVIGAMLLGMFGSVQAQSLLVATGGAGNTYSEMFKELMVACGNTLSANEKNTSGSNENVDLLVGNKVNAAIIQTDVMFYRSRTEDLTNIKTLVALHPEEVHFIALNRTEQVGGIMGFGGKTVAMNSVTDLSGKRVGAAGGSVVTAQVIRLQGEISYTVTEFPSNKDAMNALDQGKVDAIVLVGGQPLGDVNKLNQSYKLLSINDTLANKLKNVYHPAKLNYRNMNAMGVPTVATDALFVARAYKSPQYVSALKELRSCFKSNLTTISETLNSHPAWQQVDGNSQGKWVWMELK